MDIVIVTDAWLPQTNGVVRTLERTGQELTAQGHKVTFITPQDFATIPCPTYPEIRLSLWPWFKVGRLLRQYQPDCIHIATEGPLGIAAWLYCRRRGIPFTTAYHTRFPEYVYARCRLPLAVSYAWLRYFHNKGRGVMVPTASIQIELRSRGFENPLLWARGVDLEKFAPGPAADFSTLKKPVAILTGRVAVEKNIEAFLSMPWPGSKVVVGDGPARAGLQAKYPDAHFTGKLSDADMVAHLRAADVFVFPSRTETFGNVVLEALACGLPVAAYPVPGPVDIIGQNQALGALDDNLATAAQKALNANRDQCRAHATTFTWPQVTKAFASYLIPIRSAC